ncbi:MULTISPECIES: sensor histidine kinase [unclassified Brevundimonas]|uniref:sensor histidine kinase n=1 Tax=unclassified Brevundimonas TaxID=2622653 RepID=UPI0025BFB6E8|nr:MULTISPECIES: sensor histidine kinase [unclassified Brevundimonas]
MKSRPRLDLSSLNFIRQAQPIYRRLLLLLAAAFVVLGVTNIITFYMLGQTATYAEVEKHSHKTQIEGWRLISMLTDAETGQRGFMLTANTEYLAVYNNALTSIPEIIDNLNALAGDDPVLNERLLRIEALYLARRQLMVDTVNMTSQGRIGEAVGAVRSGQGKALMDAMRVEVSAMSAIADERTRNATRSAEQSRYYTTISSVLAGVMIVILGIIGAGLVRRQIGDLLKAQREMDKVNIGLEAEVRDRTSELVRANEEIQRFAYIVSHDLRAPLVNVMGYTSELEHISAQVEALLEKLEKHHPDLVDQDLGVAIREDAPEAIGFIRASTTKMDGLIKAILRLSRDGRRELSPVQLDMHDVVQGLVDAVAHPLSEGDGRAEIGDLPTITHDRLAIEQIFGNLIDNAIKYRKPEQSLLLAIKGWDLGGNEVEFEIADNGRGIAEKDHERVFELFRRSGRQDQPGEGLGLAFVRNSVRRLGGSIDVESRLGEGTTFRIRLPKSFAQRIV